MGSLPSSVRTSKTMLGWRTVLYQDYHGGVPPTLSDIVDGKCKVGLVVQNWLGHQIHAS